MFRPYAEVLSTPGAVGFSGWGLIARLPMSMFGLAMVFAVEHSTGSYADAGFVVGAALLGQAAAAPLQARAADRYGQLPMLIPILILHGVALGAFTLIVDAASTSVLSAVAIAAVAIASGATLPQIGALVRARWARLHARTPRLHTAYALESVLDEVVFVAGPPLVTVLAITVHHKAGLVLNLILTVAGGAFFAAQRRTDPGPRVKTSDGATTPAMPMLTMSWVIPAFLFMGGIFGAVEVATVAFADEAGSPGAAGVILAVFAGGSLVAGVVTGSLHWRSDVRQRFLVGQALLAIAVIPLPFIGPLMLMGVAAFIAGFAISPTLISGFSLVEAEVPAARLTEGLAWAATALNAGVALGAAATGPVIDAVGASTAYWVPVACGGAAVLACVAGRAVER